MKVVLLLTLGAMSAFYLWECFALLREHSKAAVGDALKPTTGGIAIGFVTNVFDTLGVGAFAPTAALFRSSKLVSDELIPGTLNVGHCVPSILQAFIFIVLVPVSPATLILMIAGAVAGAWIGAGHVAKWSRRTVQLGMGCCLLVAAGLMGLRALSDTTAVRLLPPSGTLDGLEGVALAVAVIGNCVLGALMTLGIGLYAPCMVMVSALGLNAKAAFPIMMGSCAFLMPAAGIRFIRAGRVNLSAAIALTIGGVPGVLLAAYVVKSLPLTWVRWIVVVAVLYTATTMIRAAVHARRSD